MNLPPAPVIAPDVATPSLLAYVWRGERFDEIGEGVTHGDSHRVTFHLGALKSDVVELRAMDEAFYPGQQRPGLTVRQPTFLAYLAGAEDRAGTAWPHDDGKGHRLKLRRSLPDGAMIELRSSDHYLAAGEVTLPRRKRKPTHQFGINA